MSSPQKSYELTPTQLRKFKGFETVTDEEALHVIFTLKELSQIFYHIYSRKEQRALNETEVENPNNGLFSHL